jgi:hypothetical protein
MRSLNRFKKIGEHWTPLGNHTSINGVVHPRWTKFQMTKTFSQKMLFWSNVFGPFEAPVA